MDQDIDNTPKGSWFSDWQESIAWLYLMIIAFDFLIAPIVNIIICSYFKIPYIQWQPVTMASGGIFHLAMGSIIGVTSWTKGMAAIESIRNQPDYSNTPYMGGSGGYQSQYGRQGQGQVFDQPVQPTPAPPTTLQAPKRGIPKG